MGGKFRTIGFFVLTAGFFISFLTAQPLWAVGNIQVDLTDETVENQAVTTRMRLEAFTGTLSSSGDSDVSVDSFVFTFNDQINGSTPQDSIDTIVLSYQGNERDTADVDGNGPYKLDLKESFSGDETPPEKFSVDLIMRENPEHDAEFDFHLDYIRYREDPGGANNTKIEDENDSLDEPTTDSFTVKADIEAYNEIANEDFPIVLASESEDIPLVHLEFAGQNLSSGSLGFEKIQFKIIEQAGNVVSSPPGDNDYGDFNSINLIRSDREKFGEGDQEIVASASLSSMSLPPYFPEFGGLSEEDALFSETTDEAHYYITISTNQGWGVEDGGSFTQFLGYGDAWTAQIEDGMIGINYDDTSDTVTNADLEDTNVSINPKSEKLPVGAQWFYHSLAPPLSVKQGQVDKYFGQPTINQDDRKGLDFHPDAIFGIVALGKSDSGSIDTYLDEITLRFPGTSEDFVPREDLRNLKSTKFSGLAIWRNTGNLGTFNHSDELLKLSPPDDGVSSTSSWQSDTVVRLRLQEGFKLPSPSESGGTDQRLEVNRGLTNLQSTIYITALFDRTGNHPDTFSVNLPSDGLKFSDGRGVNNGLTSPTILKTQPVGLFFEQFPEESGDNFIGAPDGPTPVIGLNALDYADDGGTEALLDRVDVSFETEGDSFTPSDLNPIANADSSGISIWRDNSDHAKNKVGVFQPNIDERLPLEPGDCGSGDSCKNATRGDYQEGFRSLLRVDHASSTDAKVPENDSDTTAGSEFFIAVNTSSQADNSEKFRATLGNPAIEDGPNPQVRFVEEATPGNELASVFASGDSSALNRFYSQDFIVNTITSLSVKPLFSSPTKISTGGSPKGLLGVAASDGSVGDQKLEEIKVTFKDGGGFDTTDLRGLGSGEGGGVLLYRDDGDEVFSSGDDEVIPLSSTEWESFSDTHTVDLIPSEEVEVPDSSGLNDFYVAVRASGSIELGDQFRVSIRGGDIRFDIESSGSNVSASSPVIRASLPILVNDRTSSPHAKIKSPGDPLDVLGINAADQGNNEFLDSVKIEPHDVNQSNFEKTDLMELRADTASGIALWRDTNDNGTFEPDEDLFLEPDAKPTFNNQNEVLLEFTDNAVQDTSIPGTLDNQDDFFVVLRASSSMQHGDDFEVEIPSKGIKTTSFTSGTGNRTNPIVRGSANITSINFTDTDLMNDRVAATVRADNQDTAEIRLALDDAVHGLPPSQYEVVDTSKPDQPDGNKFTFDDLSVRVSADTIGLVARGFNDTGPTDFSNREILFRRDLAGINLEDRSNVSLANALAADEDFGIVVFGEMGGSNTNTSDPAFDPSSGETLKVIPPEDGTVTMEVFNIDQKMVYQNSTSIPGQPLEWDGQGMDIGGYVNNGAYIIKVKSGSEEKSFPVMVVK